MFIPSTFSSRGGRGSTMYAPLRLGMRSSHVAPHAARQSLTTRPEATSNGSAMDASTRPDFAWR